MTAIPHDPHSPSHIRIWGTTRSLCPDSWKFCAQLLPGYGTSWVTLGHNAYLNVKMRSCHKNTISKVMGMWTTVKKWWLFVKKQAQDTPARVFTKSKWQPHYMVYIAHLEPECGDHKTTVNPDSLNILCTIIAEMWVKLSYPGVTQWCLFVQWSLWPKKPQLILTKKWGQGGQVV